MAGVSMQGRVLTAVVLACAGSAHAVSVNPNGLGQVLLFPYYTVNQHDTLFSIANDGDVGKVVKVRFREGLNSRTAFEVFVFLAPHDTWVAGVGADAATGGAALTTSDHSCTLPALTPAQAFSTSGFTGDFADGGPTDASRTREGWIEVIAAGDIVPGSPTDYAVTPIQGGTPGDGVPDGCAHLSLTGIVDDLIAPFASLYGSGVVIDVPQGTFYGYAPTAISGFTQLPLLTRTSSADAPNLDQATSIDSALAARAHVVLGSGDAFDVDFGRGVDAVSAVLMKDTLSNDYLADPLLGASTDWVVTFPTRAFYVDERLDPHAPGAPFEEPAHDGLSIANVPATSFDRAGFAPGSGCEAPACVPPLLQLARTVNVLAFVDPAAPDPSESGALNSAFPVRVDGLPSNAGRTDLVLGSVALTNHLLTTGVSAAHEPVTLFGLPAIGFMVYNIINTQAGPGLLANYGGAFAHRGQAGCAGAQAPCR